MVNKQFSKKTREESTRKFVLETALFGISGSRDFALCGIAQSRFGIARSQIPKHEAFGTALMHQPI
jgi:hypothetical protein